MYRKISRSVQNAKSVLFPGMGLRLISLLLSTTMVFAGEETTIDGVVHIKNDNIPPLGSEVVTLEELWRAGGQDDETIFGSIVAATTDEDGNIYLLDAQLSTVHVYSPEGEFLRTLSREGEGPGEIQRGEDILFLPDGTIGVAHFFTGKVVRFDKDGVPSGTLYPGSDDPTTGGLRSLRNLRLRGNNLVACGGTMVASPGGTAKRTSYIMSITSDGTEKIRYLDKTTETSFGRREFIEKDSYFADDDRWALGPDGKVYAAVERDRYKVHVYDPDGTLIRVIERDYEPRKRTAEEKDRVAEGVVMIINGERVMPDAQIEENAPCISGMWVTDDGTLWVRSSHGGQDQPDGIMITYDLFDASGHYQKQVSLACDGDAKEDALYFLADGKIALARGVFSSWLGMFGGSQGEDEGDEPPEMEVILYQMPSQSSLQP